MKRRATIKPFEDRMLEDDIMQVTRDAYLIFYGPGQIGEVDTEQAAQELADRFSIYQPTASGNTVRSPTASRQRAARNRSSDRIMVPVLRARSMLVRALRTGQGFAK